MTSSASDTALAPHRGMIWVQIEGALLIALGIGAVLFPALAGAAAGVVFGWILIALGIVGLGSAFPARPHIHFGWALASSILTIIAGLIVAFFPLAGTTFLVLAIAAWLILDGVSSLQIGLGLRRAGAGPWIWPVASAVADWILAAFVVALGPIGGAVFIGVVVGIDLILGGVALLTLGRALGRPSS